MLWLRRLWLSLPCIRKTREKNLDEEMESYLLLAADEARREGASEEEARLAARRDLGSAMRAKEAARSEWLLPGLDRLLQDARYAVRTLWRAPLYTGVAVVSLALGIGAATAVFSLVEGVLLKPLAYREPNRLIYIQERVPALAHIYPAMAVNFQHFTYWHDHTSSFEALTALLGDAATLSGAGTPSRLDGVQTSADFFRVVGTQMALGRGFLPGEDRTGKNHVVVLSNALWRSHFGSAPDVVGKTILLDGIPTTVIGVLPETFTFFKGHELGSWAGLGKRVDYIRALQGTNDEWDGEYDFICIGRLKRGITQHRAFAEIRALTNGFTKTYHVESEPQPIFHLLQDWIASPVRVTLWVLLGAVLTLLLIVCLNLANLSIARSTVRVREFSIRAALGAGQGRLMQQVATETLLLSLVGGALGLVFATLALHFFVSSGGVDIPRLNEVTIDGRVMLFVLGTTAFCAMLFGLVPAARMGRSDPQESLKNGSHSVSSRKQALQIRDLLIGVEAALSTVLLFVAALLISSLFHLLHVDRGFHEERDLAVDISLPDVRYKTVNERNRFFDRVLSSVRGVPGVRSAATVMGLPLTGETHVNGIELSGGDTNPLAASRTNSIIINVRFVSADYFATLGIPLLKGKGIDAQDMQRHVTVVSERFAAKVWPRQNPLGKRFKTGSRVGEVEVIGVVKDVPNGRLDKGSTLIAYVPYTARGPNYGSLVVRTNADPAGIASAVRKAIWGVDPDIPVPRFITIADLVNESVALQRFEMRLSSAFGLGALCLALIGVYGVVAYNVSARRTEMGVRLAIGAKPNALVASMTWRGLRPLALGLLVGLCAAIGCGWFLRSLLFEVQPITLSTIGSVVLLLLFTGSAACLIPALTALRLNPASVLRYE